MPPEMRFELLVGDHSSSDATAGIAAAAGATVVTLAGGTVGGEYQEFCVLRAG